MVPSSSGIGRKARVEIVTLPFICCSTFLWTYKSKLLNNWKNIDISFPPNIQSISIPFEWRNKGPKMRNKWLNIKTNTLCFFSNFYLWITPTSTHSLSGRISLVAVQMKKLRQVETNVGITMTGNMPKAIQWKVYTVDQPFNLSIYETIADILQETAGRNTKRKSKQKQIAHTYTAICDYLNVE